MDGRSFGIEMCRHGYVLKEFDLDSFPQEITFSVNHSSSELMETKKKYDEKTGKIASYSVMFYYTPQFAAITQVMKAVIVHYDIFVSGHFWLY